MITSIFRVRCRLLNDQKSLYPEISNRLFLSASISFARSGLLIDVSLPLFRQPILELIE